MDSFFLIIILIVVISLISSAAKKKKPAKREDEDRPPVRAQPLSDIQRAFMLMDDFDNRKPQQAAQSSVYRKDTQPAEARPTDPYLGSMGVMSAEGAQARGVMDSRLESVADNNLESVKDVNPESVPAVNKYIPRYHAAKSNVPAEKAKPAVVSGKKREKSDGLNLFGDQNECAKAVIYAEILTRRNPRAYSRR